MLFRGTFQSYGGSANNRCKCLQTRMQSTVHCYCSLLLLTVIVIVIVVLEVINAVISVVVVLLKYSILHSILLLIMHKLCTILSR